MKIETSYWSAIPVEYDEFCKFADEATDEIERLEDAVESYKKTANDLAIRVAQAEEEIEKFKKAFAAQSRKLQIALDVAGDVIRPALAELKWKEDD